jgi:hypothetical protein
MSIGRGLAAVLQAGIQRDGYGGTDAQIERVVVFLTARQLLKIEDISWVIRHPVFIVVGGVVIGRADRVLKRESIRVALGDKGRDIERRPLA